MSRLLSKGITAHPRPKQMDWETALKYYVYDSHRFIDDYIVKIMSETAIFKQNTTPNLPVFWSYIGEPTMHYKTLAILLLLHKLHVRPQV